MPMLIASQRLPFAIASELLARLADDRSRAPYQPDMRHVQLLSGRFFVART
jgi:hypothetical protein